MPPVPSHSQDEEARPSHSQVPSSALGTHKAPSRVGSASSSRMFPAEAQRRNMTLKGFGGLRAH